ncbi:hypothetical protein EDC94DRAFT_648410 [Helicostylum pulchrum]|nr:hypothetical protein EDC94DRAFT_648410 [Helicostylum pulchrum]
MFIQTDTVPLKAMVIRKVINGITLNSKLKEVDIPSTGKNGIILAVIISLMKTIWLFYLSTCYREDPVSGSESPTSSTSSTASTAVTDWKATERKNRIMQNIELAIKWLNDSEESQYVPSFWEDVIFNEET